MTGTISLNQNDSPSDRRRAVRVPCHLDVDIVGIMGRELGDPVKAWVSNASLQGICLRLFEDVAVGAHVSMVIFHAGYDSVCLGEVVWRTQAKGGHICGLRISHWSYLDRTLQEFLTYRA